MKKIIWLTIILVWVFGVNVAAEEKTVLHSGGGMGFAELWIVNIDELNKLITPAGFAPLDNKLWIFGGGLFTQGEFGLRYSNIGAGGAISSTADNGKYARLSYGYGGVMLDLMTPLAQTIAVSMGGTFGLGRIALELVHNWPDQFGDGVIKPVGTVFSAPVVMIKPEIGVHYSLVQYVDLHLQVGYSYSHLLGRWKVGHQILPGEQQFRAMHGVSVLMGIDVGF